MLAALKGTLHRMNLWADAINTPNYLRNRSYTGSNAVSSYEDFVRITPDVTELRAFGSQCYVHVPKQKRKPLTKYDERGHKGIIIGYERGSLYKVFYPYSRKTEVSKDVRVNEK